MSKQVMGPRWNPYLPDYSFKAAGYRFSVPGFADLTPNEQDALEAVTSIQLKQFQECGAITAPTVTQIVDYVVEKGRSSIRSARNRKSVQTALERLESKGLLARADIERHPNRSSTLLKLVPDERFLSVEEEEE